MTDCAGYTRVSLKIGEVKLKVREEGLIKSASAIEIDARNIEPYILKDILLVFPIQDLALQSYNGRVEDNKEKVKAILETMHDKGILLLVEMLDDKTLIIAATLYPQIAQDILRKRAVCCFDLEYLGLFAGSIAAAVSESVKPQKTREGIIMQIAKEFPASGINMEEFINIRDSNMWSDFPDMQWQRKHDASGIASLCSVPAQKMKIESPENGDPA